ncbi:E75 nuclear receptor [Plakobranchus ocellatus]|uniref:E75 nuclear receptor n=1 Tax=Plakobranchus ocellatus TaxID=259542 RepID=A0AAV3Z5Y1_9GAST|nr:E75 nuclear receptor [Plakobranchus ocellatus]
MVCSTTVNVNLQKPLKKRPSVLPPCRVCGCVASGLHYGVVTCEACNGFFRRSLKRRAVYFCSKENKCDVIGKRRGECSFCRYHKCLAVGMSRTAVKTGRYSDKTRLAYALESDDDAKGSYSGNSMSMHESLPFDPERMASSSEILAHRLQTGREEEGQGCADEAMDTEESAANKGDNKEQVFSSCGVGRPKIMSSFVEASRSSVFV